MRCEQLLYHLTNEIFRLLGVNLFLSQSGSSQPGKVDDQSQDRQKSRKRWKKAERASKAADEEYAEISKEQENMKVMIGADAISYFALQ